MSFQFGNFNAENVDPSVGGSSDPVPPGKYRVQGTKADWKDTKNKDGQYLEIVFEILKGEHEGKRLYGRLNLRNKSADACRIAEGELSALCHAINVKRPRNEQAFVEHSAGGRCRTGGP